MNTIYIDVDGTLLFWHGKPGRVPRGVPQSELYNHCEVNLDLVNRLRQLDKNRYTLVVWSTGGKEHAEQAVRKANIEDIIDVVLSKPDLVIDDNKNWSKRLRHEYP